MMRVACCALRGVRYTLRDKGYEEEMNHLKVLKVTSNCDLSLPPLAGGIEGGG